MKTLLSKFKKKQAPDKEVGGFSNAIDSDVPGIDGTIFQIVFDKDMFGNRKSPENDRIYVTRSAEWGDQIGKDHQVFGIILNKKLELGTTITTSLNGGLLIMISYHHLVEQIGESFLHYATLLSENNNGYPAYLLTAGTEYHIATSENYKNGTFIVDSVAEEVYRNAYLAHVQAVSRHPNYRNRGYSGRGNTNFHHNGVSYENGDDDILIAGALYMAASAIAESGMNDDSSGGYGGGSTNNDND